MGDIETHGAASPRLDKPRKHRIAKRILLGLLLLVVLAVGYLIFWPSPIDPVAFDPPPRLALEGPLAPNERLHSVEVLAAGKIDGPEDVEVDSQGAVYTGTADGRIVRVESDGQVTQLATTGGRPAGLAFSPDGALIVADAVKGLLSIDPQGQVRTLVAHGGSQNLGLADDVDVARDGTIYFSDATDKFAITGYMYDMLEGRPHGRLLRYDPVTKETTTLMPELLFANGVALSQNEDFVLVNETYRFRVMRYWLSGPKAGTSDVFVDNLPGYPDNITSNRHGTFWLALFTVRDDNADWLSPRPRVKSVMAKLPAFLWPKPRRYAFVIKLDENGAIQDSYQDPTGDPLYEVTSAFERDGYLYLGSLHNDRIGKFKLP